MQVRIGPSGLGDPCPKCLGRMLLAEEWGESDFSMYPWIGTAVHYFLESHVFQTPGYLHEQKVYVGDVPGYGPVKGTADLVHIDPDPDSGNSFVLDWKIVGLKKIKSYRVNGPPTQYRYQAQLYGRGCELAGNPVDFVAVCFIPRDSGSVKDIWIHEEAYQPEMAEAALKRAGTIYEIALRDGLDVLPSADACYHCNNQW